MIMQCKYTEEQVTNIYVLILLLHLVVMDTIQQVMKDITCKTHALLVSLVVIIIVIFCMPPL
jgi:hypothetical protein